MLLVIMIDIDEVIMNKLRNRCRMRFIENIRKWKTEIDKARVSQSESPKQNHSEWIKK